MLNRWFVLFLWTTVLVELMGKLTTSNPGIKIPMYNFFNGIEFTFYLSIFLFISEKLLFKIILRICLGLFILFFLYNLIFLQGLYTYNNHTHTFGAAIIIFVCLLMFYQLSASETEYFSFLKRPLLFIISGLLMYYSGNIFNTSMLNYMAKNDAIEAVRLYKLINHSLNVILYGSFCIGFIFEVVKRKIYIQKK
ncbi:MAG: hypothetical protein AAB221_12335 [Bacteroidota bacterium]